MSINPCCTGIRARTEAAWWAENATRCFTAARSPASAALLYAPCVPQTRRSDLVPYTSGGEDSGWQKLYAVPVLDKNGHVVLVIEYIRDITFQKRVETNMNELAELYENLEAQNDMLMEILNQRERYKEDLEQAITQNVEKYIRPSLNYLKKNVKERDIISSPAL